MPHGGVPVSLILVGTKPFLSTCLWSMHVFKCGSSRGNGSNIPSFWCKEQGACIEIVLLSGHAKGTHQGLAPSAPEGGRVFPQTSGKARLFSSIFFHSTASQSFSAFIKLQGICQYLHCIKARLNLLLTSPTVY